MAWQAIVEQTTLIWNFIQDSGIIQLFIAVSSLLTMILSIVGIRYLTRKERNTTEYNMAYKLIEHIVQFRDSYYQLRSPNILNNEYPKKFQTTNPATISPDDEITAFKHVFTTRWQNFQREWEVLYSQILVSEVFWSSWAQKELKELNQLISTLKYNIEQMVMLKRSELLYPDSDSAKEFHSYCDKIYSSKDKDSNDVKRFRICIGTMINYLKHHL